MAHNTNGSLPGQHLGELQAPSSINSQTVTSINTVVSVSTTTTTTTAAATNSTTISSAAVAATSSTTTTLAPAVLNADSRWIFGLDKIEFSPSRQDGISKESELTERQEAALFISDLGIKLKV